MFRLHTALRVYGKFRVYTCVHTCFVCIHVLCVYGMYTAFCGLDCVYT